jgi:Ca2+-binding RTX toxin-like protein
MIHQKPPPGRTILGAGALIATACATALFAVPANAAPTIPTFSGGVLTINGDAANNVLVVGQTPAHILTLNGSPVLGGTVTRADVQVMHMDGGAGSDTLKLDETNGVMPPGQFVGGEGRDNLVGGSQSDSLIGGNGIDRMTGGPGDDTVSLGADSDQFTSNPGDGNDHIDGDAGTDTLIFNGSDRAASDPFESESLQFNSDGSRTTIRRLRARDVPPAFDENTISFSGFEQVKAPMAGGPNAVFFGAGFASSDVSVVRVDLGPPTDPVRDRQGLNDAAFVGSERPDRIRIGGSPAAGVTVTGLGPTALITGAQRFTVQGGGGDDVIDAAGLAAGTVGRLHESGGADDEPGDDTLIGHPGSDELSGGGGDDRLEGRGGDDILDGGPGNNVIIP